MFFFSRSDTDARVMEFPWILSIHSSVCQGIMEILSVSWLDRNLEVIHAGAVGVHLEIFVYFVRYKTAFKTKSIKIINMDMLSNIRNLLNRPAKI